MLANLVIPDKLETLKKPMMDMELAKNVSNVPPEKLGNYSNPNISILI